jgi:hypothetical protein
LPDVYAAGQHDDGGAIEFSGDILPLEAPPGFEPGVEVLQT